MKEKNEVHQVVSVALAYIRCSCGWEWRKNNSMKNLTDEDLALETGMALVEHQKLNQGGK